MKLLLTAFEPFNGGTVNPSQLVLEKIDPPAGMELIKVLLPVEFTKTTILLKELLNNYRPDIVISLGQAGNRPELCVERVAVNMDNVRSSDGTRETADNAGDKPVDEPIALDGENAYFSTLPVWELVAAIKKQGVAGAVSYSAGTYVCNHVMYMVLHEAKLHYPEMKSGFIHVPFLPEQMVGRTSGYAMELDAMVKGVQAAVNYFNTMGKPKKLAGKEYMYDSFINGKVLLNKKKNHLPAMGWNSWNAFGSGNTSALTRTMAERIVELGLDKLGYEYIVLDDGCYKPERVNGELSNEEVKFPEGFKALADYIHAKGLKFGMYNDIGTNLCAGAAVGTCGHEGVDAKSYIEWGVDFLKVDNCYYLWDNATFSAGTNAKFVYTPNIKGIRVVSENFEQQFSAVKDGKLMGLGCLVKGDYVTNIGTFDGTNVGTTPIGPRSGELEFTVNAPAAGEYQVFVTYAAGEEVGTGSWLQLAVEEELYYDDFLPVTENTENFVESAGIKVSLAIGENRLRIMNHRRQENTLDSYATLLEGLNKANPDHDVMFSICEWGKTQPQNWGYKVGDSWRILNDITFCVGADGNPGRGTWFDIGTASVTSQYDKAVIMDEFAGLDKGWNDPDMMMIGMDGLNETMCRTHMAMWCMMNSPLMLGLDLRRIEKGDWMYRIIANKELIALNQDALGIQAKRVYTTIKTDAPDTEYITNHDRCDILAKPLADGSVAICFINVNDQVWEKELQITIEQIVKLLGHKMVEVKAFEEAASYEVTDLWTGEQTENTSKCFKVQKLEACESLIIRVRAK